MKKTALNKMITLPDRIGYYYENQISKRRFTGLKVTHLPPDLKITVSIQGLNNRLQKNVRSLFGFLLFCLFRYDLDQRVNIFKKKIEIIIVLKILLLFSI
uniref:Uncharacterized protein n=1 Tax=Cacopsylla melanoneura TaxID=428564 RepID=A0A8D8QSS1_9HEMI